jgi:hypothetical protein
MYPCPFFNSAQRYEGVLGEWRYSAIHSLTSALDGGEWSASRPGRLNPRERAPGTYWIGGWVGPRALLDAVVKRKIPSPRRESNPKTPIGQPVAKSLYRLSYRSSCIWSCFFVILQLPFRLVQMFMEISDVRSTIKNGNNELAEML